MKRINTFVLALSLVFFSSAAAHATFDQYSGLVAHWKFNGDATDSQDDHNGTLNGGPTLVDDRFGNHSSAYYFDGTDDYISVSDDSDLDITGDITISAWVKFDSNYVRHGFLAKQTSEDGGYRLHIDMYRFTSNLSNDSTQANLVYLRHLNDGKWHHVLMTYDGDRIYNYVDGEPCGCAGQQEYFNGPIGTNNEDLTIGVYFTFAWYYYKGVIDDVRLYRRYLDQCEAQELFVTELNNEQ